MNISCDNFHDAATEQIRSLKNLIHDQVDEEVEPIARSNERQHMDVVNEQHERALFEQAEAAHSLKDLLEKPK